MCGMDRRMDGRTDGRTDGWMKEDETHKKTVVTERCAELYDYSHNADTPCENYKATITELFDSLSSRSYQIFA